MSSSKRQISEGIKKFSAYWENLFRVFPEAKAKAVAEMGAAIQKEAKAQVITRGVNDPDERVRGWQRLRLGSGGGYAAVSPRGSAGPDHYGKVKTWKGKNATAKQVTKWLERGHGTPVAGKSRWNRIESGELRAGVGYVRGRMFYSYTKDRAWDIARKAADRLLCSIADEIDY